LAGVPMVSRQREIALRARFAPVLQLYTAVRGIEAGQQLRVRWLAWLFRQSA
jgi:hypothetical protein